MLQRYCIKKQSHITFQQKRLDLKALMCKIAVWIKAPIQQGKHIEHRIYDTEILRTSNFPYPLWVDLQDYSRSCKR